MTMEAETPRSFIMWAGLSAISAIKKRDVWLDKYLYKLTPNIYVLLVAKSGLRKTFAVNQIAKPLVESIGNTRIISGRNSIQGILRELGTSRTTEKGGPPLTDATAALFSGEFSNLVINDPSSLTILTDLYDSHYNPEWENTLKESRDKLKNISLTMLGATNPEHFKDRISDIDIQGGFIARTLIIMEREKACINPLTEPPKIRFDINELIPYLQELAKLKGEFKWTNPAKSSFEKWYRDFSSKAREDKTGTAERLNDHVLKVAMLLSLARDTSLELHNTDMEMAIDLCTEFTTNSRIITDGTGKSQFSRQTSKVLDILLTTPGNRISRKRLLGLIYGDLSATELDYVLNTLTEMDAITTIRRDNETFYVMKAEKIAQYENIKKRIAK